MSSGGSDNSSVKMEEEEAEDVVGEEEMKSSEEVNRTEQEEELDGEREIVDTGAHEDSEMDNDNVCAGSSGGISQVLDGADDDDEPEQGNLQLVEMKRPDANSIQRRNYRSNNTTTDLNAEASDEDEGDKAQESLESREIGSQAAAVATADAASSTGDSGRVESGSDIPHANGNGPQQVDEEAADSAGGDESFEDEHFVERAGLFAARLSNAVFGPPIDMDDDDDDDDSSSTDSSLSGLRYMEDEDDEDDDSTDSSDSSLTDLEERQGAAGGNAETSSANNSKKRKLDSSSKRKAEVPQVILKPKPKSKWNGPRDLFHREMGYMSKSQPQCAQIFRSKFYGSLFSAERLELMHQMEGHEGCVNCLNFNYSGTKLASGSDDMQIKIWNYGVGKLITSFNSQHRSNVFQAKFLPLIGLDNMIVSCSRDCTVKLTELNPSGTVGSTRKLVNHRGPVHKLSTSLDNPQIILSVGEDGAIFSTDIREDKPQLLTVLKEMERRIPLYSISGNPLNFHEFCVTGKDQYVRMYDTRTMSHTSVPVSQDGNAASSSDPTEPILRANKKLNPVKKFCPHHLQARDHGATAVHVTAATYNYNGKEVLGSYNDENIYLFDASHSDGADYVKCYEGHRNSITGVFHIKVKGVNFFGDRSQFIVSGSDCGHIYLWDKETESIVNFLRGDMGGVVNVLEPHPTVPILATSGLDHDVKIWIPSGEDTPKMGGLIPTVRKNLRKRKEDAETAGPIDSRAVQFILNHMTRGRRGLRRAIDSDSEAPGFGTTSSDSEDGDDERGMECRIS